MDGETPSSAAEKGVGVAFEDFVGYEGGRRGGVVAVVVVVEGCEMLEFAEGLGEDESGESCSYDEDVDVFLFFLRLLRCWGTHGVVGEE